MILTSRLLLDATDNPVNDVPMTRGYKKIDFDRRKNGGCRDKGCLIFFLTMIIAGAVLLIVVTNIGSLKPLSRFHSEENAEFEFENQNFDQFQLFTLQDEQSNNIISVVTCPNAARPCACDGKMPIAVSSSEQCINMGQNCFITELDYSEKDGQCIEMNYVDANPLLTFINEFIKHIWMVAIIGLIAVLLCYFYIFLIMKYTKQVIYGIIIIYVLASVAIAIGFIILGVTNPIKDIDQQQAETYYIMAGVFVFIAVVLLIAICLCYEYFAVCVEIIKEASHALRDMPQLILASTIIGLVQTIIMSTASTYFTFCTSLYSKYEYSHRDFDLAMFIITLTIGIFAYPWMFFFVNGFNFSMVAGAVVGWYFTHKEEEKPKASKLLFDSLKRNLRYHCGSIAKLSGVISFTKTMRFLADFAEQIAVKKKNVALFFLACMIKCIFMCIERILAFFTDNIYIYIQIKGQEMWPAAKESAELTIRSFFHAYILDNLLFIIIIEGGMTIVVLTLVLSFILVRPDLFDIIPFDSPYIPEGAWWLIITLGFFLTITIVNVLMNCFEVIIRTIFICYFVDRDMYRSFLRGKLALGVQNQYGTANDGNEQNNNNNNQPNFEKPAYKPFASLGLQEHMGLVKSIGIKKVQSYKEQHNDFTIPIQDYGMNDFVEYEAEPAPLVSQAPQQDAFHAAPVNPSLGQGYQALPPQQQYIGVPATYPQQQYYYANQGPNYPYQSGVNPQGQNWGQIPVEQQIQFQQIQQVQQQQQPPYIQTSFPAQAPQQPTQRPPVDKE